MKRIACEMCGSNNVVKQDGLYTCQNCGTKYSVEEARKLMVEGTVDVSGSTVRIDTSDELKNLYTLARRAISESDIEHQRIYYEMILRKDPNSWEAYLFYRIAQLFEQSIWNTQAIKDSANTVLGLIWEGTQTEQDAAKAIKEVANVYIFNCQFKYSNAEQSLATKLAYADRSIKKLSRECFYNDTKAIEDILFHLGDAIKVGFEGLETIRPIIATVWEIAIDIDVRALPGMTRADRNREEDCKRLSRYTHKIRKYDPSYQVPKEKKTGLGALMDKFCG